MSQTTTPRNVLCHEPFAGNGFTVRFAEVLRTDDPRYLLDPSRFSEADTTHGELRAKYMRTLQRGMEAGERVMKATLEADAPKPPKPIKEIPFKYQVLATRHIGPIAGSVPIKSTDEHGEPIVIHKGSVADARWKIVKRNRDAFVSVLMEGAEAPAPRVKEPARSLVCVALDGLTHYDSDLTVAHRIEFGQIVRADHPLVEIQPHSFLPAGSTEADAALEALTRPLMVVAGPRQVISDSGAS
jgi:hypothetical protein